MKTVQQMIDELNNIEDKNMRIMVWDESNGRYSDVVCTVPINNILKFNFHQIIINTQKMKKTILLFALTGLFLTSQAQTATVSQQEKPVTITLLPSQLNVLQQILQFSYQWLPKSDASAKDVGNVLPEIQKLYPLLVPVADTAKKVTVVVKKGGR